MPRRRRDESEPETREPGGPLQGFDALEGSPEPSQEKVAYLMPAKLADWYVRDTAVKVGNSLIPTVWFGDEQFYVWDSGVYMTLDGKTMRRRLLAWLADNEVTADPRIAEQVVANLEARQILPPNIPNPCWLGLDAPYDDTTVGKRPRPIILNRHTNFLTMGDRLVDLEQLTVHGVLSVQTMTPAWFCRYKVPYQFDRNARCPKWLAWLHERVDGDEPSIHLIQEFMGYCLTRDTKLQAALVICGETGTGKSTLLTVLEKLVGSDNCSFMKLSEFGARFALGRMDGKMLNISDETSALTEAAEQAIKWWIGGRAVDADRKYLSMYKIQPTARLVASINKWPRINDTTGAFLRRLHIVPFEKLIDTRRPDTEVNAELEKELPGIFNWAMDGRRRLLRQGGFTECGRGEEVRDALRSDFQPHKEFVEVCIQQEPGGILLHSEILREFRLWKQRNGMPLSYEEPIRSITEEILRVCKSAKRDRITVHGQSTRCIKGAQLRRQHMGQESLDRTAAGSSNGDPKHPIQERTNA